MPTLAPHTRKARFSDLPLGAYFLCYGSEIEYLKTGATTYASTATGIEVEFPLRRQVQIQQIIRYQEPAA